MRTTQSNSHKKVMFLLQVFSLRKQKFKHRIDTNHELPYAFLESFSLFLASKLVALDELPIFIFTFCVDCNTATAESPRFIMLSSKATFSSNSSVFELAEVTSLSAVLRAVHSWKMKKKMA